MNHAARFYKSVGFAFRGLSRAWHNEPNFRWEAAAAVVAVAAGIWLNVSAEGLALLILCSTLVISLELVNTMIELMSDMLKPRLDNYIKNIKDLTAAAVVIAALGSIGVAICILIPRIIDLLWQ